MFASISHQLSKPYTNASNRCTSLGFSRGQGRKMIHVQCVTAKVSTKAKNNKAECSAPYNVVITGSTKGIGKAMAIEFLRAGDNVVVCSRSEDGVQSTVKELQLLADATGAGAAVKGISCNVAKGSEVSQLADYVVDTFGSVDLWINNAGTNVYKYSMLTDTAAHELAQIVETNVLGVMLGCKEAIRVMRAQEGGGHIFNMDGAGTDGNPTPRFAAYGATKRGLLQLGKSLQAELKMLGISNVGIHNLSPGMVTTELLMAGANTPTAKFFINCLAEPADVVAEYLVPRVRQVPQQVIGLGGGVSGSAYIKYLTPGKAYSQIAARIAFGQRKNRFVAED